ncbi:CDP-alcohol phosphatidyltransferase family protein [Salisaeta longa]|uniref:CDP-alcohol phosphatidyltransferase family protein n=1 Tax=Salisaeta longa TaxID=503170 RepID=UPI0003B70F79|nr:CDP-alcohol phosphatidyltransferase family protein [Salisaeta longa]
MSSVLSDARWGRFWTVPNALSLLRLVLVVPIAWLLWTDGSLAWLFGLVLTACFTDWLDGRVARWSHSTSEWGKVLDPLADKFAGFLTVIVLTFRTAEPTLPLWFFGALVARDAAILAGSYFIVQKHGHVAMSIWSGKAATFWLALTVLAAILKADPPVLQFCVWITTTLLAWSFIMYVRRFIRAMTYTPPPTSESPPSPPVSSASPTPTH